MAMMVPYSEAGTRPCSSKLIRIFFNSCVIFIATLWRPDWQKPWMITLGEAIQDTFPEVSKEMAL
jgi:hypothetical protein